MTMQTTTKITLYCTEGGADKVYTLWIEPHATAPGEYVVNAQWGRRGGPQLTGTKTPKPVSKEKAEAKYAEVLKSKQAKGYHPGEDAPAFSMVENEVDSGIRPMLLTPGKEEDVAMFVDDDDWGAQQKMNGKHLIVKSLGGKVTGINKRGLECPMPSELQGALKHHDVLFDSEIVGTVLYVFDLMAVGANLSLNHREDPLSQRYKLMQGVVDLIGAPGYVKAVTLVRGRKAKQTLVKQLRKDRKEGVVFKKFDAPYHPGRANSLAKATNVKIKFYAEVAAEVLDWTEKSSIEVALRKEADLKLVSIGKVTVAAKYAKQIKAGSIVRVKYLYATENSILFQAHLDPTDDGSVIADQEHADPMTALKHEGKEND